MNHELTPIMRYTTYRTFFIPNHTFLVEKIHHSHSFLSTRCIWAFFRANDICLFEVCTEEKFSHTESRSHTLHAGKLVSHFCGAFLEGITPRTYEAFDRETLMFLVWRMSNVPSAVTSFLTCVEPEIKPRNSTFLLQTLKLTPSFCTSSVYNRQTSGGWRPWLMIPTLSSMRCR
jgi:hypothetical protein